MNSYVLFRFRTKPLPAGSFAEETEAKLREFHLWHAATDGEPVWQPPSYDLPKAALYIRNYLKRNKKPA